MDDTKLLEGIHRIGQIECSDPGCRACANHREDAMKLIAQYRAEARAEADTKIAYWKRWVAGLCERIEEQWPQDCDASREAKAARAAILADEPKEERGAEVGDACLFWESGVFDVGILSKISGTGAYWAKRGSVITSWENAIVLMRRAEVERRIEEAASKPALEIYGVMVDELEARPDWPKEPR